MRLPVKYALGYCLAAFAFFLALYATARVLRPEMPLQIEPRDPAEIAAAEASRHVEVNRDAPPTVQREVDYSEGTAGAWWPKHESPILTELVREGKLPAVAERVGDEPVVLEGIEGTGKHGGTWFRFATNDVDMGLRDRMAGATLVRWSPQGLPLVPHVAKSYTVSPDSREFVFHLRKGMKWSDGHPFTADDILYFWNEEALNPSVMAVMPPIVQIHNKPGKCEKIDDLTVRITFPETNGTFLYKLATWDGIEICNSPRHYLRQYHPEFGDPKIINPLMEAKKSPSRLSAYMGQKNNTNSLHPRIWPWIYRTYRNNPPQALVRNPYYWAVDPEGNQLPYVDRLLFENKSQDMLIIGVANGEVSMMGRHYFFNNYTLLASQSEKYGYELYHWLPGNRTYYQINPNLNRRVHPDRPDTKWKHQLLNDKRFRQALSLALNRKEIIEAEYFNQTEPAQASPGPQSLFNEPASFSAFTEYDPARANKLLDEIGLTGRDREGYRTFPDGSRMTFFLTFSDNIYGPEHFVVDHWANVGIRLVPQRRSRALFQVERMSRECDFLIWESNGEFFPLMQPRSYVPFRNSDFAVAYGRWFDSGGLYGDPRASAELGCEEPPKGHPLRRAMELYDEVVRMADLNQQIEKFREIMLIAAENVWTISISTSPPYVHAVKKGFRNVPRDAVHGWDFLSPVNTGIETYFFDEPYNSPGALAQMKHEIMEPTPPPDVPQAQNAVEESNRLGSLIRFAILGIAILLVILLVLRHPFVGRRLLIMVPTLLVISVVVFVVIQLPPGDFLTARIIQLQEVGTDATAQQIVDIKQRFLLEEPMYARYFHWLGLKWFLTFNELDEGLLQGNMGFSMETLGPVNYMVGDRILLTFLISLGTILLTWTLAIPIGIYSAVKQYSIGDYILSFVGFIGMCIPGFLLALLLMFVSGEWLGIPISGLFSSQYGAQPEWTWGKVADLLQHIWIPVVVLGVGGTAGMIRVMRANLLDELKKPYVTTARAKGVRPARLLFKYPVRLALNPFISGIGGLFPQLVSGGAIVAMVLSLPTVGPLMLNALFSQDMYLAGSMLMVLSLLGVIGTLVSDLLLLWLDPRIRLKGGAR